MAKKNKKLEEKMTHMEKWIETKKKKVNVVQWLNQNVIPPIHFLEYPRIFRIIPEKILKQSKNNKIANFYCIKFSTWASG